MRLEDATEALAVPAIRCVPRRIPRWSARPRSWVAEG